MTSTPKFFIQSSGYVAGYFYSFDKASAYAYALREQGIKAQMVILAKFL